MDPSIYRLRLTDILSLCVMGLIFLGILMVQSASTRVTGQPGWRWTAAGSKHLMFAIIALSTFIIVGHLDYKQLCRPLSKFNPIVWMLAFALLTCTIVLIPHVGIE